MTTILYAASDLRSADLRARVAARFCDRDEPCHDHTEATNAVLAALIAELEERWTP